MRVSIDKDDPGYRDDASSWRVRFNGHIEPNVVTADDVKQYVIRYQRTAGGDFVRDDDHHPRIERIDGRVELIPPGNAQSMEWL